jgi:hypothetical protein
VIPANIRVLPLPSIHQPTSTPTPVLTDARLHHPHLSNAATGIGSRGFSRPLPTQPEGIAHPAIRYPQGLPRGFQEAQETHVSLTWQPSSFSNITMQLMFTGISPMHCIGKLEPFQSPELLTMTPNALSALHKWPP